MKTIPVNMKVNRAQLSLYSKEELINLIVRYEAHIAELEQKLQSIPEPTKKDRYFKPHESRVESINQPYPFSYGDKQQNNNVFNNLLLDEVQSKENAIKNAKIIDVLLTAAIKDQRTDLIESVHKILDNSRSSKIHR